MPSKCCEIMKSSFQNSKGIRKLVATIGIVGGSVALIVHFYRKYERNKRRAQYPKDTVILHQFPRGPKCPSQSPFALKLETWLRMANIPYQNEFSYERSSTENTVPFITYNGIDYSDSQFIIEFLSKALDKKLNQNLDEKQLAISRCLLKTCEESFRWVVVADRFLFCSNKPHAAGFPKIFVLIAKPIVKRRLYAQGYGRHSRNEIYEIGKNDLKAINDIIGENKFVFGDTASDVDSALFGMLSQIVYHDQGPLNEYLNASCQNILRFVENMKETYWPDWNENITKKF